MTDEYIDSFAEAAKYFTYGGLPKLLLNQENQIFDELIFYRKNMKMFYKMKNSKKNYLFW